MSKLRFSLPHLILLVLIVLFSFALFQNKLPRTSALSSALPSPNPYWVLSTLGGHIPCGQQQSSVWIEVPQGFTGENGAEFRCDRTGSPSAWDDRGYLISFYPIQTPLSKALTLVFEIDPVKAANICEKCFTARFYDAGTRQWRDLPTTYDKGISRVYVSIEKYLPTSGFVGYADRFIIALFPRASATAMPTSTSSPVPTATSTVKPTQTVPPATTSVPTLSAAATPVPTWTPKPTVPICPGGALVFVSIVLGCWLFTHSKQ